MNKPNSSRPSCPIYLTLLQNVLTNVSLQISNPSLKHLCFLLACLHFWRGRLGENQCFIITVVHTKQLIHTFLETWLLLNCAFVPSFGLPQAVQIDTQHISELLGNTPAVIGWYNSILHISYPAWHTNLEFSSLLGKRKDTSCYLQTSMRGAPPEDGSALTTRPITHRELHSNFTTLSS